MIAFLCIDLLTLEESDPYKKREETYRATNNHGRRSIVVTQVKRELHARVATTNNNHFLPFEAFSRLVLAGMNNITFEFTKPFNIRDHTLRILAGGHHEPPANVLELALGGATRGNGLHPPQPAGFIVPSTLDTLVEPWVDLEFLSIGFEVVYEVFLGGVFGEVFGEWKVRELAELFWKVEF